MLRSSLAMSLLFASAAAFAQDSRNVAATEGCQGVEAQARDPVASAGPTPPRSSLVRSKYAKPTATPSGGGSDEQLPRGRASKWHSFLPGMFR